MPEGRQPEQQLLLDNEGRLRVGETGPVLLDGTIKLFEAEGSGIDLRVFNRWGNKVYDGSAVNAGWDGTTDGNEATNDTYIYILEVNCDGERQTISGDVVLIR